MGFFEDIAPTAATPPASGGGGFFEDLAASQAPLSGNVAGAGGAGNVGTAQPIQPQALPEEVDAEAPDAEIDYAPKSFDLNMEIPQRMRANSFQDFWNNAGKDFKTIADGLPVVGNVIGQRLTEALPQAPLYGSASKDAHIPSPVEIADFAYKFGTTRNPLQFIAEEHGMGSQPLYRIFGNQTQKSDPQMQLQMLGDALQGITKNYTDPLSHGDLGRVAGNFTQHPLFAAADLASVALPAARLPMVRGGINMVQKTAGAVGPKVAPHFPTFQKAAGAVQQGIGKAKDVIAASPPAEAMRAWSAIRGIIRKADNQWQKEFKEHMDFVKEAYDDIPAKWSDEDLTDILTWGDMEKRAAAKLDPDFAKIEKYAKRVNSVNEFLGQKLVDAGVMTRAELKRATYGDFVLGQLRKVDPNVEASVLNTSEGIRLVLRAEKQVKAQGAAEPVYMGIIPKAVSDAVRGAKGVFGGVGKSIAAKAKKSANEASLGVSTEESKRLSFATPREIGKRDPAVHEMNPVKAAEVRIKQELALLKQTDMFKEILENPVVQAGKGGDEFPVKRYFEKLSQAGGLPPGIAAALPEFIDLPKVVRDQLDSALSARPDGVMFKAMEATNRVFKDLTLGLDPGWAGIQSIQNMGISAYSKFRGIEPRELAASIMSHIVGADPKFQKLMPPGITMLEHGEKAADAMTTPLAKLAGLAKPITDTVYAAASISDTYTRTAHAAYELMKQADAVPEFRVPLKKAFDLMARYDQIEKVAANPVMANKALGEVNKWFGDYSVQAAQMWKEPRAFFPFFLWWLHAGNLTLNSAVQTPIKNRALLELTKNAPGYWQGDMDEFHKKLGMVPIYDEKGQQRKGPNDGPLYRGGAGGMVPMTQAFELAELSFQTIAGEVPTSEASGLPPVNSIISFFVMMSGRNPQNMREWSDPTAIHVGGKQYRLNEKGENVEINPRPNALQLGLRALGPKQETAFRETMSGPFKPSDFTTLGKVAPKRGEDDQPLKQYPMLERFFQQLTKSKPTEATFSAEDSADMKEREQKRVDRARDRYQSEREEDMPTWAAKILGGDKDE